MSLATATPAQQVQLDALTYAEWGALLTPEGYAARERRLRAHPWSLAALRTWVLCAADGSPLCSCETYRTPSFRRTAEGTLEPGVSFAIASVFTPPPLRGHGHATRLMDLLAAELEREPHAHAALLFSDVGPRLYARSGYQELPAWDWHLPARADAPGRPVHPLTGEEESARALEALRRPEAPFFFWPSPAQLDWHLERGRIYLEHLGCRWPASRGAVWGAAPETSTALWGLVGRAPELTVLLLDARSPEATQALLGEAQREAHRHGLSRVVVWEEEPGQRALLARVEGATRVARSSSLPMVRPLRPDLAPASGLPIPRGLWV